MYYGDLRESLRKYEPSMIVMIYECRLATYIMYGYGRGARSLLYPLLEDQCASYMVACMVLDYNARIL